MFVKLYKVQSTDEGKFYLSEVRLNISHILFISENADLNRRHANGEIDTGLSPMAKFSDILVATRTSSEKITVVGEPELIETKINTSNKQLLKG